MYKFIIRPILFLIDPERVHHLVVRLLKILFAIPGVPKLSKLIFHVKSNPTHFAGIEFPNRLGLAAGFDKNALLVDVLSNMGFGHLEIGTVTPRPQPGNPRPRLFRLPADKALINRMGFNNDGVDVVAERLKKKRSKIVIGGNIGKNTVTPNEEAYLDYLYCFERLYDCVDYFVVNVSCPNISSLHELQDRDQLNKILQTLINSRKEKSIKKPILLKVSPDLNQNQVDDAISVAMDLGIDGLVVSNTSIGRNGLQTDPDIIKEIGTGGLSGLPLKEKSTQMIKYIIQKTNGKLPVIGVGGIMDEHDALEKIEAGATLVQIYTGYIYAGPFLTKRINKMLSKRK
ncbi:MAG: quinone-dependent dihydroorotate dehydrogenase [Bacteroidales bacterium]|nr:quinone-dependent dihydroorotate dehydrogenase [Bacteroidales bacterium]